MTSHEYALPELLEGSAAHRIQTLDDADGLRAEVDRVAAYGRELWEHARRVADELRTQAETVSGDWTGEAWDRWEATYAATLDLLAGPRGDSGYGAEGAATIRHAHELDSAHGTS